MLQQIHDKAKGWIAYAIVGFIAIPFTLFGISSYLGGGNSLVAATVNGEDIPVQQVQNEVRNRRQELAQMFQGQLPPAFAGDALKKQVLEQIISRTLLRQAVEENGYRASSEEIFDAISQVPNYQKDGVFDEKVLERQLAVQRISKANFIRDVRQSLTIRQFPDGISETAFLPTSEVKRYAMLQNQTRDVDTYTLKKDDYKSEVKITKEEEKAYYDKHSSRFMTLDKVKLSYLAVKQSDLEKLVEVNEDALKKFFDENADTYVEPEQRKIAHILIKLDYAKDGKDAEKNAREIADGLYSLIKAGSKTFEDVATNHSDDKLAAKKAGEIGLLIKGDMGALFEKAAFSLKKGEMSEPVKTEAGIEIIKILDLIEQKQKSYSEVKDKVEKAYRAEKAEKLFIDKSDKLQTLAFENESSLDASADAINQKIQTSDWLEKGMPLLKNPLFTSPKVLAAAFSDDVLKEGKNSELIEINQGTVIVIRLQEHKPPKQKALTDVSKQITSILTDQKLRKLLIEKGEKVLKSLKETGSWDAVKIIGGSLDKVKEHKELKRTDSKVARVLSDKIFSMQKPKDEKTSFDNVILPVGDYVLIGLKSVKNGAEENSAVNDSFEKALVQREQEAMLKAMREEADVQLFIENIQ